MQKQVMIGIFLFTLCFSFASTVTASASSLLRKTTKEFREQVGDTLGASFQRPALEHQAASSGGVLASIMGTASMTGKVPVARAESSQEVLRGLSGPVSAFGGSASAVGGSTAHWQEALDSQRGRSTVNFNQLPPPSQ